MKIKYLKINRKIILGKYSKLYQKEIVLEKKPKMINFAEPLKYTFVEDETRDTLYTNFFDNYKTPP